MRCHFFSLTLIENRDFVFGNDITVHFCQCIIPCINPTNVPKFCNTVRNMTGVQYLCKNTYSNANIQAVELFIFHKYPFAFT